jgi:RNA polymerase sigma-70 factor (ECF subfamily)
MVYGPILERLARRRLHDATDADDAVQKTWLRAWQKRRSYGAGSDAARWLFTIHLRVCVDMIRARDRRRATQQAVEDLPGMPGTPDHEDPARMVSDREFCAHAVAGLAGPSEVPFEMYLRGFGASEIAKHLERDPAVVRQSLHRTKERLRQTFAHGR